MGGTFVSGGEADKVFCDQPRNSGKQCNYLIEGKCPHIPAVWGKYCIQEMKIARSRVENLKSIFAEFQAFTEDSDKDTIGAFRSNQAIFVSICQIYANDLKPIRLFHNQNGGIDCNRRASILARLIVKHRPIEFDPSPGRAGKLMNINERFALHVFAHFLNLPQDYFKRVPNRIFLDLLFTFIHRDPQIELLVSVARMISFVRDEHWPEYRPECCPGLRLHD
jgi:hypothetical protein